MDAPRSHITNLSREVLGKRMLHAQIPGDGVGQLLVRGNPVGGVGSGRGFIQDGDAGTAAGETSVGKETGGRMTGVHIIRGTNLRGNSQTSDVVIQNVVGQAEAGTDGGITAVARRICDAEPGRPIVLLRSWRAENQWLADGIDDDAGRI